MSYSRMRLARALRSPAAPPSPDIRGFLAPDTLAAINDNILPEFQNTWGGPPAPDVTVTCNNKTEFIAAIDALNPAVHTKIVLANAEGDWTSSTISIWDCQCRENGGSLRITSTPDGPTLNFLLEIVGSTYVQIDGVKLGKGVNIRRVTSSGSAPTPAVVRLVDNKYGAYWLGIGATDYANWASYGVNFSDSEEVVVIGGEFRRCYTPTQGGGARRHVVLGAYGQELSADGPRFNAGSAIWVRDTFPADQFCYVWMGWLSFSNVPDDQVLWEEHTDLMDFAQGDLVGTKLLVEFCGLYGERVAMANPNTGTPVGVGGVQINSNWPQLYAVFHSNFFLYGGYSSLFQGKGDLWIERCTFGRAANVPTEFYQRIEVNTDTGMNVRLRKTLATSLVNTGCTLVVNDVLSIDPRATASAPNRMVDRMVGPFTKPGAFWTYGFVDDGSYSREGLPSALWTYLEPKSDAVGYGPPDPADWPAVQLPA